MDKSAREVSETIERVLSVAMKVIILLAIPGSIYNGQWSLAFISLFAVFVMFLPAILGRNYNISIPTELELIFMVFIYTGLYLGTVNSYFKLYWWWDIMVHAISGIALGFIGFAMMYVLYSQNKIRASYFMIAIFSFSFAVSMGALWEIFEYFADTILGWDMQPTGLVDTIGDLIVDSGGALLTSVSGYYYMKHDKDNFVKRWIVKFVGKNPRLFK